MNQTISEIISFIKLRFSLHEDSAHDTEIIHSISRSVEFKGSNLWALIFAIFVASIGLNVNSTAVIIGAMLISPLMGPIMGIGLGMGINDIELIRKASKNLLIAVIISVVASSLYFLITPLHEAQSELLARTHPSIWDVFIALFGGLAGIVGSTRKEKNNVIPGVAIATALMPPLCTAGYGIAIGNWYFVIGAFYLFFINSVFICASSYLVVRYMNLPKKAFEDKAREKKVMKYILYVIIITLLPSVYLAFKIVDKSIFESNANNFLKSEFNFPKTYIIKKNFRYEKGKKVIDLVLIGEDLPNQIIAQLKSNLKKYKINDAQINIKQGLNSKRELDFSEIKSSIIEEIFSKRYVNPLLLDSAVNSLKPEISFPNIIDELQALYPNVSAYTLSKTNIYSLNTDIQKDSVVIFIGKFKKPLSKVEQYKFKNWLKLRLNLKSDSLRIIVSTPTGTKASYF